MIQFFFLIAVSVANGIKTLLVRGVSMFFVNGKPTVINGPRKLRNRPSWVVIFLVLPFSEIPLFPKYLITFLMSFTSLFVRVIPEPVID